MIDRGAVLTKMDGQLEEGSWCCELTLSLDELALGLLLTCGYRRAHGWRKVGNPALPIPRRSAAVEEAIMIPIAVYVLVAMPIVLAGIAIAGRRGGPDADAEL